MSEAEAPAPKAKRAPRKPAEPKAKPATSVTDQVLVEVAAERKAQDERWGEQNHRFLGGPDPAQSRAWYHLKAEDWKRLNARRVAEGALGWDGVLLEEVFEALAEGDADRARAELVQVAAVAVCAIEAIDRAAK